MSEKFVEVAAFSMPVEAHAARGMLEAEGIKAVLTGAEAANVFSGVQGVAGKLVLHVPEADAGRAGEILAAHVERPAEDADVGPADDALWLCPLCGDAVSDELSVCPSCQTERPPAAPSLAVTAGPKRDAASQDIQAERTEPPTKVTADTPLEAVPSAVEGDLDLPDPETFIGDDLVRRAFVSSWIVILAPYSLWLLARLAIYPGKISPRMMPRLYWTIVIDAFWCLLFVLLCGPGLLLRYLF